MEKRMGLGLKTWTLIFLLLGACTHKELRHATKDPEASRATHEAYGKKYMVASQGPHSTKGAMEVLKEGGNIFDAAVTLSFMISVERPQSTGLGGGGFTLFKTAAMKEPMAQDFREVAPLKAYSKMYLNQKGEEKKGRPSVDGPLAVGVPGLVAGVLDMHKKYGSMPLKRLLQPAIELAEKGFKVYPHLARSFKWRQKVLARYPDSRRIFLRADGSPKVTGDWLIQKDLAQTLKLIAERGKAGFYEGPVAQKMVDSIVRHGGLLSLEDLRTYKVKMRTPVSRTVHGKRIFSMPPPSSGGVHVLQLLDLWMRDDLHKKAPFEASTVHRMSQAMQLVFRDRARFMGDPDFVKVPTKKLLAKKHMDKLHKRIQKHGDAPLTFDEKLIIQPAPLDTTHFTLMDNKGNVVSSTQTINGLMGSALVAEGTGIVMNNEMDDFATKPGAKNIFGAIGGTNNLVEPKKRPLSSMTPTIVLNELGQVELALGSPSGTRILTCVAQSLFNRVYRKWSLYDSVAALRFHHQIYPKKLQVDEGGFSTLTKKTLESQGHEVQLRNLGCKVQATGLEGEELVGVSDPRAQGLAQGL